MEAAPVGRIVLSHDLQERRINGNVTASVDEPFSQWGDELFGWLILTLICEGSYQPDDDGPRRRRLWPAAAQVPNPPVGGDEVAFCLVRGSQQRCQDHSSSLRRLQPATRESSRT